MLYFRNEDHTLSKQSDMLLEVIRKKNNRCNGRKKIKSKKNFAELKKQIFKIKGQARRVMKRKIHS